MFRLEWPRTLETRISVRVDTRRTTCTHSVYVTRQHTRAFDRENRTCATNDVYDFRFIVKSIAADIVRERIAVEVKRSVSRR